VTFGLPIEAAVQQGRKQQAFLYFAASRAYRAVLSSPELVARFSKEGLGEYWGKIVSGRRDPPFTIDIADDEWNFEHKDTHYLLQENLFTRRSNSGLQLTGPSHTLGPRS
jgi:hypothetical protein